LCSGEYGGGGIGVSFDHSSVGFVAVVGGWDIPFQVGCFGMDWDCVGGGTHDDGTTARTSLQEEGSKVHFVEMGRMIKIMSKKEDEKEEEEKETAQPTSRAITELV
jgi:hypothetical protein